MFKHLSLTFRSFLRPRYILRVNTYSSEHVRPSPAPPPTQPLSPSELPLSPPLPFPRCNLAHASVQPLPATQRPLPSACLLPRSRCTWNTVLFIFSVSVLKFGGCLLFGPASPSGRSRYVLLSSCSDRSRGQLSRLGSHRRSSFTGCQVEQIRPLLGFCDTTLDALSAT